MELNRFYTPNEAKKELGVGYKKIISWVASGELACKIENGRKLIPGWAIEKFSLGVTNKSIEFTRNRFYIDDKKIARDARSKYS